MDEIIPIKSLDQARDWCCKCHGPVVIRNRKGPEHEKHKWTVVSNMPLGALDKMIRAGRIYEYHGV